MKSYHIFAYAMTTAQQIIRIMKARGDDAQAKHLARFFKTGEGEYGYGDAFLGIRVPETRNIVREFRTAATIDDINVLTDSPWHEIRLAGLLLLIEMYKQAKKLPERQKEIVDYYISILDRGNNWDLVDVVAPKILGDWLVKHPEARGVLYRLAGEGQYLWRQRVAIISTWKLIQEGSFEEALLISRQYISHTHHLIHKASGWMLREIGKRGGLDRLLTFLDEHSREMPRTMLRYAIEMLPEHLRRHYMAR